MKVLTALEMREVDRLTSERYGVPSVQLMENASIAVVEAIGARFGPVSGKRILVICGKGNNGGDGAAAARHLDLRGASVSLILLGRIDDTRGDARRNFELARSIAETGSAGNQLRMIEVAEGERLSGRLSGIGEDGNATPGARATNSWSTRDRNPSLGQAELVSRGPAYDMAIDAILGTGLGRPVSGIFLEAVELLVRFRSLGVPIVSVDVPSGIASDSADLIGPSVQAGLTITFTAPKPASVLPPACRYGGELVVAPIGSPIELIEQSGARLNLIEAQAVSDWLDATRRSPDANKGDVGKVLIVAGSRGKTGAACLAGAAAMKCGAGLVTVGTPESAQPVVAAHLLVECTTEALPETAGGSISANALDRILDLARVRDVLVIGPGLGSSEDSTRMLVKSVAANRTAPLVIDADALNCLAPWPAELKGNTDLPMILTPHPGEMARLAGRPVQEVVQNRIEIARQFAQEHFVILVLKGSRTLIAAPSGQVYINPTGNAGMATGGSGDVLAGMIGALLAQAPDEDPLRSTIAAVYIHGFAGDRAAARLGTRAMIASDITACLSDAFLEVGGSGERIVR